MLESNLAVKYVWNYSVYDNVVDKYEVNKRD